MLVLGTVLVAAMQFAWPPPAEAQVELMDERSVGEEGRTIVMTMRLRVEPDVGTDRVVVRLSDARIKSIDGSSPGETDPAHTLLAVGRVMKNLTPTLIISHDGRYLETRDLDRLVHDVLSAVGLPSLPVGSDAFASLLSSDPSGHTRLTASAEVSLEAVRMYTRGFLEKAVYSPMTTTLTAELEAATMRPVFAERTRTFSAVKGKHKVEGRERRTHRFTWVTDKALTK